MTHDEFIDESGSVIKQVVSYAETARRDGFLALTNDFKFETVNDREILKYGLCLVADGVDRVFIDKVLSNIIEHEKDEYTRKLNILKKEAVLMIQDGTSLSEILCK